MASIRIIEIACVVIVGLYVATRMARADRAERARFLRRFLLLAISSWLAEDTVIHAYGFYGYSRSWDAIIDRVPLMIIVIWPVVIDSAWQLARRILPGGSRYVPLLAAGFVFADASLIEPIAVQSGLWRWTEPGIFAVPPIGILGWAIFAVVALALFDDNDRKQRRPLVDAVALVIAPLLSHVVLVALWWSCFRWINLTIAAWPAVIVAWILLVALAILAWRKQLRARVPISALLVRMPAAAFFFVLLGIYGQQQHALIIYAIAFAPPYCALLGNTPLRNER